MKLEIAKVTDAKEICELLNLAYRGSEGWTTENALIQGDRCSEKNIESEINTPNNYLLVSKINNQIQACILIQRNEKRAYIGSFAVHPKAQNSGYGSKVLDLAEQYAVTNFRAEQFIMVVLSSRIELIKYYERRGYQRNGNIKEYPVHLNVGIPFNIGLTIEELIKSA